MVRYLIGLSVVSWWLWTGTAFAKEQIFKQPLRVFGLVIGCNRSDDSDHPALRYADDDAVKNAMLLVELGRPGDVILLTQMDAESQRLFPNLFTVPATKAALNEGLEKLNQKMKHARSLGQQPVLYIFYSGHGDVVNGEGYVTLADSRLYRDDFLELLGDSEAISNHVVIDSCRSYFMVFERGPGGKRRHIQHPLFIKQQKLPDNTGVLLSSSSASESHEWEAFQAGVFSHEVRSAFRGAADLDKDGNISYEEASAFVWTANASIPNQRFRPSFYVHPPASNTAEKAVLVKLPLGKDKLHLDQAALGHCYIEDADGIRIADFHLDGDPLLALMLPSRRPLFVRQVGSGKELVLPDEEVVALSSLAFRQASSQMRGAGNIAFRQLFRRPFGNQALEDYRSQLLEIKTEVGEKDSSSWIRQGIVWTGTATAVAGVTMSLLAVAERNTIDEDSSIEQKVNVNNRIKIYNTVAVSCYAVAATVLITYLIWSQWPESDIGIKIQPGSNSNLQLLFRF